MAEKYFPRDRAIVFFRDVDLTSHKVSKWIAAEGNRIGEIAQERHPGQDLDGAMKRSLDLQLAFHGLGLVLGATIFPQYFAELAEMGIRKLTGSEAPRWSEQELDN